VVNSIMVQKADRICEHTVVVVFVIIPNMNMKMRILFYINEN